MRLYAFEAHGRRGIGAEQGGRLVDLGMADLLTFLTSGKTAEATAKARLAAARREARDIATHRFEDVRLLAPVPRPGKILCSGINYRGHLDENPNARLPESPFFFAKLPSVVIGPGDPIVHPALTRQLDWEVELAVVIGRRMKRATEGEAMEAIAGYTILNDVSARDVQFKDQQITLGKNFDTFAPMGPCLVTADEVPDPGNLRLRSILNGRLMQDGSTNDWIYPLPQLLSFLSGIMTLEPGDVVSTGTPAGVGVFRTPPIFLQPSDVIAVEVEGIGRMENAVVEG